MSTETMTTTEIAKQRKELDRQQAKAARAVVKDVQGQVTDSIRKTSGLVDSLLTNPTFQASTTEAQIRALVDLDNLCNKVSVELAFLIGSKLRRIRDSKSHGTWKPYVEKRLRINYRRACRYMSIHDTFQELRVLRRFGFSTVSEALDAVEFFRGDPTFLPTAGNNIDMLGDDVANFWEYHEEDETHYNEEELLGIHSESELLQAKLQREADGKRDKSIGRYESMMDHTRKSVARLKIEIEERFESIDMIDMVTVTDTVSIIDQIIETYRAIRDHLHTLSTQALSDAEAAPVVESSETDDTPARGIDMESTFPE